MPILSNTGKMLSFRYYEHMIGDWGPIWSPRHPDLPIVKHIAKRTA